ncbi:uncharacterized protein BYT42DRAFT_281357 [Radiomyces spectabilis]|uniref:uncharacterized protein n=1 Tax=Radiomyces spectabilis TaxID=64574 RepID=UPI00221EB3A4|nr:uncharacterized protein BYT42DRAFT_281357 [Radiomyces spectabilis]KAI8384961.1 hypothetical protein BYT42DRAFT_281357 [Radiomyces spectabilis]
MASESEEDDYGPVMATWGSQTTDSVTAWKALVDPEVKLGPAGVGSGNLHRRGPNYKPLTEEAILSQRMKQNAPKPKANNAKKHKDQINPPPKSPKSSTKPTIRKPFPKTNRNWAPENNKPTIRKPFPKTNRNWAPENNKPTIPKPFPRTSRKYAAENNTGDTRRKGANTSALSNKSNAYNQRSSANESSAWTNQPLTTQPFWEAKNETTSIPGSFQSPPPPPPPPPPPVQRETFARQPKKPSLPPLPSINEVPSSPSKEKQSSETNWSSKEIPDNNANRTVDDDLTARWDNTFNSMDLWTNTSNTAAIPESYEKKDAPPVRTRSRFSLTQKPKYSEYVKPSESLPINYQPEELRKAKKLAVAPPPASENVVVVTINIQLQANTSIALDVRLYDDPKQLALQFSSEHNIKSPNVVNALYNLIKQQKDQATTQPRRRYYR